MQPKDTLDNLHPVVTNRSLETTSVEEIKTHRFQSWKEVLFLAYSSLGAVYGDIGTSPLYVLNSIKYSSDTPTQDDIYGAISVIFYLFIFIVIIKYSMIVLTFGSNNGEGGQVAIYARIARHLRFGPKGVIIPGTPEYPDLAVLRRSDTEKTYDTAKSTKEPWRQKPLVLKVVSLVTMYGCFLGCSLVISDGLLTPTTSVLSAVSGIQVAKPDFSHVLAVSEAVIVFLFVIQLFGSHRISQLFAPIILLWLVGLTVCGIINITTHPAILKALSPYYAIMLLKKSGIDALGGAMLAITGTEAMFLDLGHFGRRPTQIGISCVLFSLIIAYLGQGAYLVHHPEAISNAFYLSIPGGQGTWQYWLMFVLATLSTVIASQALILGVFSILSQLINLDCFPRLRVKHVSAKHSGRVYVPVANILLLIGVCATTAGFGSSDRVTAAYGLGISLDFVVTSSLMILCMLYVWNFHPLVVTLFCLIFVPLEMCLVIANLKKVPHGAWFPLLMCAVSLSFLVLWRYCRERTVHEQLKARKRLEDLFPDFKEKEPATVDLGRSTHATSALEQIEPMSRVDKFLRVKTRFGTVDKQTVPTVAMIYSDTPIRDLVSPNSVPEVYYRVLHEFGTVPSVVIFCVLRVLPMPYVPSDERVVTTPTKIPNHYKCVVRFGFMEEIKLTAELRSEMLAAVETGPKKPLTKPVLHIFESNNIRARHYLGEEHSTKNPLKLVARKARQFTIHNVYRPLDLMFCQRDQVLALGPAESEDQKLFLGGNLLI